MSDTAAFFAKKKTKKKKFKAFNANKIDASAVTTSTHVDAPEISAETMTASLGGLSGLGTTAGTTAGTEDGGGDDQWTDSAGGWGLDNKISATSAGDSKIAELLDMQALSAKRNEQDDVAERLRIEETKAKLARAKEGMAKEAERLAAEKEAKDAKAAARTSGSGGGGGMIGPSALVGGKWVPSHIRNAGAASGGPRFGIVGSGVRGPASMDGAGFQKPVDMASEELFPDLAAADKILEKKEKQEKVEQERMSTSQPARALVGWGSKIEPAVGVRAQRKPLNLVMPAERKPLNLALPKKSEEESEPKNNEKTEGETKLVPEPATPEPVAPEPEAPAPDTSETKAEAPATTPVPEKPAEGKPKKKVLKKKKKKDLSTFKPKS